MEVAQGNTVRGAEIRPEKLEVGQVVWIQTGYPTYEWIPVTITRVTAKKFTAREASSQAWIDLRHSSAYTEEYAYKQVLKQLRRFERLDICPHCGR